MQNMCAHLVHPHPDPPTPPYNEAARLATAAVGHACNNNKGPTSGNSRLLPKGWCKHLANKR